MIYTVEKAQLLAEQLQRFRHVQTHHLAGQFANLDFWMSEVDGALAALDSHKSRFEKLRDAQNEWVEEHKTQELVAGLFDEGAMLKPLPPKQPASSENVGVRRSLVDATYHLLTRFYRMGLLDENELRSHCDRAGTSIDPADLQSE